jgi:threonine dehydratase
VKETGMTFIHPFDDPLVIAGQGTIGKEILEQLPEVTHIFVPIGGGGLIAGIAQYVKSRRPDVKIIGVEPVDSNAMQLSVKAGKRVVLTHVGIFADGVAVKQVGEHTLAIAKKYADNIVTVNTDQMCAAIKAIFEDTRAIVEPAGALAVAAISQAALPADAQAVAICSGANMSFEKLQLIAERTLIGSGKEAIYSIALPERPGALQTLVNKVINGHSITEFSYRLNKRDTARIFLGISVAGPTEKQHFENTLDALGYSFSDLSGDDLTKEHVRHMIGGASQDAQHEKIFSFTFPERPGALADFLKMLGDSFNISLFHYRSAASDNGSVLIGFEAEDKVTLLSKLKAASYPYEEVTSQKVVAQFIRSF